MKLKNILLFALLFGSATFVHQTQAMDGVGDMEATSHEASLNANLDNDGNRALDDETYNERYGEAGKSWYQRSTRQNFNRVKNFFSGKKDVRSSKANWGNASDRITSSIGTGPDTANQEKETLRKTVSRGLNLSPDSIRQKMDSNDVANAWKRARPGDFNEKGNLLDGNGELVFGYPKSRFDSGNEDYEDPIMESPAKLFSRSSGGPSPSDSGNEDGYPAIPVLEDRNQKSPQGPSYEDSLKQDGSTVDRDEYGNLRYRDGQGNSFTELDPWGGSAGNDEDYDGKDDSEAFLWGPSTSRTDSDASVQ